MELLARVILDVRLVSVSEFVRKKPTCRVVQKRTFIVGFEQQGIQFL